MDKMVSHELIPQPLNTELSLADLTPGAFTRALKTADRQAFITLGMTEQAFQGLVGSRTSEDRAALALRTQRLAHHLMSLAGAIERGSLERSEEELPWDASLDTLPNTQLRNALKVQLLSWQQSGMTLEEYMDRHPRFRAFWKSSR